LIEKKELSALRDHIIYLPLSVLQKHVEKNSAKIVAIGGGGAKIGAIYAALKAKFFNNLITDALTAFQLITLAENEKNGDKIPDSVC
jgi:DNA-binding transcriptional regulator LsrR (DeoR family)